jgi:3'-5' exoribonuclease
MGMFKGIKEGDVISAIVILKSITMHQTKSKKSYLRLTINDGQGEVSAFLWDADSCEFKAGDTVKLKGTFGKFDGKEKIDIISLEKTTLTVKLPTLTDAELDVHVDKFRNLMKSIKDKDFKILLDTIFDSVWNEFITAPAACSNHQAYIGGLIEHSVNVATIAIATKDTVGKHINADLLIAGCLLHDIGKIKEYAYTKVIERTTSGKLIGHTSLGLMIISMLMPNDFPIKKSTELFHLILSHHGKREWGAPVEPLMKEAILLHQSDMLDSYASRFDKVKDENKVDDMWSQYDSKYNRAWYLASTTD